MSNYDRYTIEFLDPDKPYPITNEVFTDVNKAKETARNHSKEFNSCCLVIKDGTTIAMTPWQYYGTPQNLLRFI